MLRIASKKRDTRQSEEECPPEERGKAELRRRTTANIQNACRRRNTGTSAVLQDVGEIAKDYSMNDLDNNDLLFHFTSVKKCIEYIMPEKRLKYSHLIDTNDPKEYSPIYHKLRNISIDDWGDEKFNKVLNGINETAKKKYGVICFCSNDYPAIYDKDGLKINNDIFLESWKRSRMWSQYAENHFGFCLVISKSKLSKQIDTEKNVFQPVIYRYLDFNSDIINDLEKIDANDIRGGIENECIDDYIEKNFKLLFFTKNVDYRDEAEYRLISKDERIKYCDIKDSLYGIIIGHRTNTVYHKLIEEFCLLSKINCYKMGWKCGAPLCVDNYSIKL